MITLSDQLNQITPLSLQQSVRASIVSAGLDPTKVPGLPAPPTVVYLPEGDATDAITAQLAKPAAMANLKPGGKYSSGKLVNGHAVTASITGAGAKIIGDAVNRANIALVQVQTPQGPQYITGIAIAAPNVEVAGIHANGFGTLLEVTKPGAHIHDFSVDGLSRLAMFDAGADGFIAEDIAANNLGGDLFYVVASNGIIRRVTVAGMTSPNSEHCIRLDGNGTARCENLLIDTCDLCNNSSSGKEVLACRNFDDLNVIKTIFRGWIRFGQDGTPPVGASLMKAALINCFFPGPGPGGAIPGVVIDIKDGCDITLDRIAFGPFANPRQSCIHVKGTSKLSYRKLTVLGASTVPIITSDPGAVIVQLP